jgi:hypothetical protein
MIEQHESRRDPVRQGILVMTAFGLGWAIVGITGLVSAGAARIVLYALAVAAAVAVALVSFRFRSRPATAADARRRVSPNAGRYFNLINAGQTIAVLVAVFGLTKAGVPGLIPSAACFVVGLHFLPLARIFDVPRYRWTGAQLILVAAAGVTAFAYGAPIGVVLAVVGLPAAAVLWATSILVAYRP